MQAVTDLGAWRIVMLNSNVPDATHGWLADDQLTLLEQALAGAGSVTAWSACIISLWTSVVPDRADRPAQCR